MQSSFNELIRTIKCENRDEMSYQINKFCTLQVKKRENGRNVDIMKLYFHINHPNDYIYSVKSRDIFSVIEEIEQLQLKAFQQAAKKLNSEFRNNLYHELKAKPL